MLFTADFTAAFLEFTGDLLLSLTVCTVVFLDFFLLPI
ncbi:hypothetical protein LKF24_2418 [Lactococcus lactis subsp. lactis]|nr:hypothetical protein LKF24_2418 [Lactococcus lactis subsp. lactis]